MTSNPSRGRPKIAVCVAAALMATASTATLRAGESDTSAILSSSVSDRASKSLQLGVGKSVIVDLPEEAGEIYVGDPKIANACPLREADLRVRRLQRPDQHFRIG